MNKFFFSVIMLAATAAQVKGAKPKLVPHNPSVETVVSLMQLQTDARLVTVLDKQRGGNFIYSKNGIPDYGIMFPAKHGGCWKRTCGKAAFLNWFKEPGATDSAIIQRLFDSKKEYIYIPEGVYYISDIYVRNSNTNIIGTGKVMFKKSAGSTADHAILRIQNAGDTIRNVTVKNITFQFSPSINTGTDKLYCLIMGNDSRFSENITIRHCTFDSSGNGFRSMINIGGNRNMTLDSCVFKNSFGAAINVTSVLLDKLTITNCMFTNWACLGGANDQYSCIGGNGGTFRNFYIYNCDFLNVSGNKFTLELTGKNYGAKIISNRFNGNGKMANGISGPFWANCIFKKNLFTNGSGGHRSGFELVGFNCTIDSNTIQNGTIFISGLTISEYPTQEEKALSGCNFIISNNILSSSASCRHSQSVSVGADNGRLCNVSILHNKIKNFAPGNSQSIGFNGHADMDNITVQGNTLEDSAHAASIRFYPNIQQRRRSVTNVKIFDNNIIVYNTPVLSAEENYAIRFDTKDGFSRFRIYDNKYTGFGKITNSDADTFSDITGNKRQRDNNGVEKKMQQ